MKPTTKQLIVGVFVLVLVIVVSLGIRHVRFSIHRAKAVENSEIIETEPNTLPVEAQTVDHELDPQCADLPEPEEQEPPDDYAESHADSGKDSEAISKTQFSKDEYARAKGSKGLEKVSLGGNDNLYRTAEGELWYVGKGPDGKSFKMQVQVDEVTGGMTIVGGVYGDKGGDSGRPRKISIGGGDNVYIAEKGQAWYVTDDYKAQVETDEATGEIAIIEQHGDGDDK